MSLPSVISAQSYRFILDITDFPGDQVFLAEINGGDVSIIDSTLILNDQINFRFANDRQTGMYRLYLRNPRLAVRGNPDSFSFDFIYNYENIHFKTKFPRFMEFMEVVNSKENEYYLKFLKIQSLYREKLGLLISLINLYPKDNEFYPSLSRELIQIQKNYNDSLILIADKNPRLFVSALISVFQEPVFNPDENDDLNVFMQENFLKPMQLSDPGLIRTNAITGKIISYLSFFRSPGESPAMQETQFIKAVDNIMEEVNNNQELHDFVVNYLIDGFESLKMESVLVHIADNHLTGECKTENEEIIRERLEKYKKMSPGNKVDDIVFLNPFDHPKRLSDHHKENVLLVFWSTECPHCTKLLPRLAKWYSEDTNRGLTDIYAVSLDKIKADWEEFILLENLNFTNVYDPEGWDSNVSDSYNLYATPTMFLLDRNLKILAKPMTFKEFKAAIQKL